MKVRSIIGDFSAGPTRVIIYDPRVAREADYELSEVEPGVKCELGQRPHKSGHDTLGNFVRYLR